MEDDAVVEALGGQLDGSCRLSWAPRRKSSSSIGAVVGVQRSCGHSTLAIRPARPRIEVGLNSPAEICALGTCVHENMATGVVTPRALPRRERSLAELARAWRRLRRAATARRLLTAPPLFVGLNQQNGWRLVAGLLATLVIVIAFRGCIDLLFRRLIPWPSLFGLGQPGSARGGRRQSTAGVVLALLVQGRGSSSRS